MAQLIGIARIGRDAETRFTQGGDAVTDVSLAFTYGRKDAGGKRPTQWVKGSLWGERGQKLAQHLTKGTSVYVVIDDAHVETFAKQDGTQSAVLAGRVSTIEFAGARPTDNQATKPTQSEYAKQAQASTKASLAAQAPAGFEDVPF